MLRIFFKGNTVQVHIKRETNKPPPPKQIPCHEILGPNTGDVKDRNDIVISYNHNMAIADIDTCDKEQYLLKDDSHVHHVFETSIIDYYKRKITML